MADEKMTARENSYKKSCIEHAAKIFHASNFALGWGCGYDAATASLQAERDRLRDQLVEARKGLKWIDNKIKLGTGAVSFGYTENGNIGLWAGGMDLCAGCGDSAGEALTRAALSGSGSGKVEG